MFEVGMLFHWEIADRPANSPSRNASSVSPRGVLIDIPVIAIRLVLDKIHLHDTECADGIISHYLSEARCCVFVLLVNGCSDVDLVARSDLTLKCSVDIPNKKKFNRLRISGHAERPIICEVQHAQSKLPDRFEQKGARIDRMAGKVSSEYRISRVNVPLASKARAFQIDCRNSIYEKKRGAMRNYPLDIIALDLNVTCRSGASPERPPRSRSHDRL